MPADPSAQTNQMNVGAMNIAYRGLVKLESKLHGTWFVCSFRSDPGVTRTRDPQLRRLLLYPLSYGANIVFKITKNSHSIQQHHGLI